MQFRWNNEKEVRRSLGKLNNMILNKEINPSYASKVITSAGLILESIALEREKEQSKQNRG